MLKINHVLLEFTIRCSEKWPFYVRSEKMCDFITLSITEISPWDAGDYECQVSFTPKISRIIETLQSNLLSLAMSQQPPAITIEFYQTGGDIGQLVSPHASSGHSIKYLKPKSFQKNRNFEIQLLSPVCSCFLVIILLSFYPVCLRVTGKLKLSYIAKTSQNLPDCVGRLRTEA